jgi:hypothetical protein
MASRRFPTCVGDLHGGLGDDVGPDGEVGQEVAVSSVISRRNLAPLLLSVAPEVLLVEQAWYPVSHRG